VKGGGQRRFAEKKHGGAWSQEGGRECKHANGTGTGTGTLDLPVRRYFMLILWMT
jgi:hypothetical protein